jgi:hypothetical protein
MIPISLQRCMQAKTLRLFIRTSGDDGPSRLTTYVMLESVHTITAVLTDHENVGVALELRCYLPANDGIFYSRLTPTSPHSQNQPRSVSVTRHSFIKLNYLIII